MPIKSSDTQVAMLDLLIYCMYMPCNYALQIFLDNLVCCEVFCWFSMVLTYYVLE